MLGPLEVVSSDGVPLAVRGSRRRLLFATLVLHRNAVCGKDHLVDVLFGDDPPARATGTVQSYVSRLRQDLAGDGARLQTRHGGYVLAVGADEIDSARFEDRVDDALSALAGDPARAAEMLAECLAWWHGGRAFAEFQDDLGLQAESTRLEEVRQRAAEALVEARLAMGDDAGAIDQLEACIVAWPLREAFRAQQMRALYHSGRQPEALRAFRRFRTELGSELGLEPSSSLTELEARMVRQDPTLERVPGAVADPQPRTGREPGATRRTGNLPLSVNALLGRDAELSRLAELPDTVRLLTLTGPGGVGKTRLAMRLAEQSAPRYPDGVWLCDLSAIREDALAAEAVTTALDVQRRQDRSTLEGLVEVLHPRRLLVVFDNCEHLLAPIAEIADAILHACPDVRIVATSREPIGVEGETVWPLDPLPLPVPGEDDPVMAMESPAVRLFVARATAAHPAFRLGAETAAAVGEICRRLDGLPLALELAAARVRSLAPADLAERLDERFTLLTASPRRGPRHHTLRATVAWSYDLLGHAEQALFDRLSVFAGRFTVDDVQRVCADGVVAAEAVTNVLAALVDKSMIVADIDRSPTRYSLLETLREFGRDELHRTGDTVELQRRHAHRLIELVEEAELGLCGPDEGSWSERLEDSFDDLRIAHRWALAQGDVDAALRLVVGAREFAFRRMRYELFTWAEASVDAMGEGEHALAPLAVATAGYGRFVRGDLDEAVELSERSLALEARLGLPPCGLHWRTMGNVFYYRGEADLAADTCQRMVRGARTSGDDARLVHALYMASVGLASAARTAESRLLADEAVTLARRTGNPTSLACALYARALTIEAFDPHRAASMLEEAVALGLAAHNRWMVSFARTELVSLAGRRGDLDSALRMAREVVDTWYRAGDWANQWLTLRHVAGVLAQRGDHEDAAVLHAAVRVASAELAMPIEASDLRRVGAILERLPSVLGPDRCAAAEARGAEMAAREVVHYTQDVIDRVLAGG
ncbi:MAG: winged helix-turn-helix domain-containing protein [Acidimicrobiales bacterium]|nr:winged helix-turn-helix domain-containing protein [Acidimicrobiales bacterium]